MAEFELPSPYYSVKRDLLQCQKRPTAELELPAFYSHPAVVQVQEAELKQVVVVGLF